MSQLLVLGYHAVSSQWGARLSVKPGELQKQITALARRGYCSLRLDEAATRPRTQRSVVITFDDGFRSVRELAFPILSEAGFRATVFVPTDFIGAERKASWNGLEKWLDGPHSREVAMMSWKDLQELAEAGWEIGSHTCSHARLTELCADEIAWELGESRRQIQEKVGECHSFSYPYNDLDTDVVSAVRHAGYTAACTSVRYAVSDLTLPRRMSRAPWIFGGGPGVIVTSLRR
jgi:peptidoglycan/xylan/chitin deacetylase (PgdA/CDA1 family)